MAFFAVDQLASGQSRPFLGKEGGCFFQELVLLTQLTNLCLEFCYLG